MKRSLMFVLCVVAINVEASTVPYVLSSQMRESDPMVMDIVYKIESDKETVNTRALAFQDGERSFKTVIRPETFIEGTDANIGDNVAANVEHKLSWKVSSDWNIDLAKVSFEILTSDVAQLPMKTRTIPATDKNQAITIAYNDQHDSDIFNALLWWYACGDEYLVNNSGKIKTADRVIFAQDSSINNDARESILSWLYAKYGWECAPDGNLGHYTSEATRDNVTAIKTDTKPNALYLGRKAYCVIDVSAGPNAERYPVTYLDTDTPVGPDSEYRTTKILLRRIESGVPYYIGVTTITHKQYSLVTGSDIDGDERYPIRVSWNQVRGDASIYNWSTTKDVDQASFIGLLRAKTGLEIDLPSDDQWTKSNLADYGFGMLARIYWKDSDCGSANDYGIYPSYFAQLVRYGSGWIGVRGYWSFFEATESAYSSRKVDSDASTCHIAQDTIMIGFRIAFDANN